MGDSLPLNISLIKIHDVTLPVFFFIINSTDASTDSSQLLPGTEILPTSPVQLNYLHVYSLEVSVKDLKNINILVSSNSEHELGCLRGSRRFERSNPKPAAR